MERALGGDLTRLAFLPEPFQRWHPNPQPTGDKLFAHRKKMPFRGKLKVYIKIQIILKFSWMTQRNTMIIITTSQKLSFLRGDI